MFDRPVTLVGCPSLLKGHCFLLSDGEIPYHGDLRGLLLVMDVGKDAVIYMNPEDMARFQTWLNAKHKSTEPKPGRLS